MGGHLYRIYSNRRPGHLFNFWTFFGSAYSKAAPIREGRLFEKGAY